MYSICCAVPHLQCCHTCFPMPFSLLLVAAVVLSLDCSAKESVLLYTMFIIQGEGIILGAGALVWAIRQNSMIYLSPKPRPT